MTQYIKRGDTHPPFEKRLRNELGEPIDLSEVNGIEFHLRDENYNVVVSDDTTGRVTNLQKDLQSSPTAFVEYNWRASDTTEIGSYKAEFVVDFGTDGSRSFPADGNYDIEIVEDIND
jgi:hypothetical protein